MSKFDNPKFVVRNESGRTSTVVSTTRKRPVAKRRVYFHCNPSCILPRHPYFKSRELQPVQNCLWNWLPAISNYWNRVA